MHTAMSTKPLYPQLIISLSDSHHQKQKKKQKQQQKSLNKINILHKKNRANPPTRKSVHTHHNHSNQTPLIFPYHEKPTSSNDCKTTKNATTHEQGSQCRKRG
uniref:Uncharacterized protein n=1 Tax=Physcomitrium patens TaxID=3218 RepID=A0A2K1IGV5_PHYPA|nr:hypothetical protein PHYPA_029103 [Physcomitrium patens]